MDKKEKLNQMFQMLRSKGLVHTQTDLATAIGYNRSNVSRALNGDERYLTNAMFENIIKTFPNVFSEEDTNSIDTAHESGCAYINVKKNIPTMNKKECGELIENLHNNDLLQTMLDMSKQIGALQAKIEFLEKRLAAYESDIAINAVKEKKGA